MKEADCNEEDSIGTNRPIHSSAPDLCCGGQKTKAPVKFQVSFSDCDPSEGFSWHQHLFSHKSKVLWLAPEAAIKSH
jgi:hypothetical protein